MTNENYYVKIKKKDNNIFNFESLFKIKLSLNPKKNKLNLTRF